jgi:hypothetical protein
MPDKDIVMAKAAVIQRCLKRIKETTHLDPESLNDIDKQDIFVLNLQRGGPGGNRYGFAPGRI